eukprot:10136217-Alexandrium_andersonii.AAC.1
MPGQGLKGGTCRAHGSKTHRRVDFFLVSQSLADRVERVDVLRDEMFDTHCPIRVRLRMGGRTRPVARLKAPVPMKGLGDQLDAEAKARVTSDMGRKMVAFAPRFYAALERKDTDAAWEAWNSALASAWSDACERHGTEKGCQVRGKVVRVTGQVDTVAANAREEAEVQAEHEATFRQKLRALRRVEELQKRLQARAVHLRVPLRPQEEAMCHHIEAQPQIHGFDEARAQGD